MPHRFDIQHSRIPASGLRLHAMNTSARTALLAAAVALAAPVTHTVHATSGVLRCKSADGTLVYTDKACADFGAKSLPVSDELMGRILREQAREMPDAAQPSITSPTVVVPTTARRSSADGCARSPTQLQMDLSGSLALGDVNRIAESYHWTGVSHRTAVKLMQRLEGLSDRPVAQTHYFDAQIGGGLDARAASSAHGDGAAGIMQVVFGGNSTSVVNFSVQRYQGCYFVRF